MHTALRSAFVSLPLLALSGGVLSGCQYDEGLIIHNMRGKVVVPRAAATRVITDADGNSTEVVDSRNIGPVYVGVFPSVLPANVVDTFPHPEIGPVYLEDVQGDTYPYGGTTIGDLRFACFDGLTCKMVSGRHLDFQSIIDWFSGTLNQPIVDAQGAEVANGEYFRQTCFDLMEVTSDEEVYITVTEDKNGDEKIDAQDLDFQENADGDFEAEFILWQQDFFWDQDAEDCTPGTDCPGFSVWAFMDGPSGVNNSFSTCTSDSSEGFRVNEYNVDFWGGRAEPDVLNAPGKYIGAGDWVSDAHLKGGEWVEGAYRWDNIYDEPVIRIGHEVQ